MDSIKIIIWHQLHCHGLVNHVGNSWLPKQIVCGQWPIESRNNGRLLKHYKNLLESNILSCERDSDRIKEMVIGQTLEKWSCGTALVFCGEKQVQKKEKFN